jgi:hypothetical protein
MPVSVLHRCSLSEHSQERNAVELCKGGAGHRINNSNLKPNVGEASSYVARSWIQVITEEIDGDEHNICRTS